MNSYYICKNKDCKNFNEKDYITHEIFVYDVVEGRLVGLHRNCECCGEVREYVNPDADIPLSEKNITLGKFSSASKEQKAAMLKKRSHEHFEKHVKERKDYLMNKVIGEMKDLGKK